MPYASTADKVRLYFEDVGQGTPILFVHEFASDHRGWEPQLREFGKRHRCIAYSARGYTPSDVPADPDVYSYNHVMRDAVAVLDHLKIDAAHFIGLSMGGYTSLQVALNHEKRVRSLVLAGTGSGSERWYTQEFHKHARELGDLFEREGAAAVARGYGMGRPGCHSCSRTRAASPSLRRGSPGMTRSAPPTPRAAFKGRAPRSTILRARSAGSRRLIDRGGR